MKKRSKYIALSVSALALVSVCSIGFATWLVGIQQTTDEVTLKAQVDNYVNDTIFLSANLSTTSVKICETSKVDKTGNNIIGTTEPGKEGIGYAEDGLKFTFKDITLKVSKTTTAEVPDTIEVSLADNNDWNKVTTNTLGNEKRPDTGSPWTYLTLGENGSLEFSLATDFDKSSDADSDYDTYTLKSGKLTQTFGWGTFFGEEAPTTFYNNLYKNAMQNFEEVVAGVTAITTELKAMKNDFTDQTITLKVEAVTSSPVGA